MPGCRMLQRVEGEGAEVVDTELLEIGVAGRGGGGLAHAPGHSSPDLAACHKCIRRSKPLTRMSTCCGLALAFAALFSSSPNPGHSFRPRFGPSTAVWVSKFP